MFPSISYGLGSGIGVEATSCDCGWGLNLLEITSPMAIMKRIATRITTFLFIIEIFYNKFIDGLLYNNPLKTYLSYLRFFNLNCERVVSNTFNSKS